MIRRSQVENMTTKILTRNFSLILGGMGSPTFTFAWITAKELASANET